LWFLTKPRERKQPLLYRFVVTAGTRTLVPTLAATGTGLHARLSLAPFGGYLLCVRVGSGVPCFARTVLGVFEIWICRSAFLKRSRCFGIFVEGRMLNFVDGYP
jgi:hypothetical protein